MKKQFGSNKWVWFLLGLMAISALGKETFAQQPAKAGAVRVVLPPGDVARPRGTQVVRTNATTGMTVYYKDVLETGVGGRLRSRLDDGSILALGPQSRIEVIEHDAQTQQSSFQLEYGRVRAQVVRLTRPGSRFEVRTNTAVAGVLGTDEIIDAFSPVATLVLCIDGLISVSNVDPNVPGSVVLNPGQLTIVQQGQPPTAPRAATPQELQDALEGSSGVGPQPVANVGTGFVTAGTEFTLSAADSFATGSIVSYQWIITRAADNVVLYNQSNPGPTLTLDTTTWQPGNYSGTLTITTADNQSASVNFGFVVLPAALANTSPEDVIQQLQLAYETLQPSEFMKLFDPEKYVGYAALQESVETSFRSLSQARVFVRRASGQMFEEGKVAIYQVDFEIQYSTKAEPDRLFVVREQATLRLQSGSGWLISDVPQGSLGSAGIPGVPGVNNPSQTNTASSEETVGGGANVQITPTVEGGGPILVSLGGSSTSTTIQNSSSSDVTITLDLPAGISASSEGVQATTFTIPAGESLSLVFVAQTGIQTGTIEVQTTISVGGSTLPGPTIPVTVFDLTFQLSSPASLVLPPNGSSQVSFNVSINPASAGPVQVSAPSGPGVTFSPSSATVNGSGSVSFTVNAGAVGLPSTPFTFTATAGGVSRTQTVSIQVQLPPVITSVLTASGTQGTAFSYQITATNNPTSFNATGLPAGLSINTTTGLISGTPAVIGVFGVGLSATNVGGTGTATLSLTINPPPPVITSSLSASGIQGTAFSYQISATNNPTSFGAGGLPAGLSVNTTTGLISGTPTVTGTFSIALSATNAGGTGTATLSLTVVQPAPVITSSLSASGVLGAAFSYQITATNSPTSYGAGGLPSGLSVNTATGLISGNPTATGTFSVALSATNSGGTGTATLSLTIIQPVPVITSSLSASGTQGFAFSYQITATNGPTSFGAAGLPSGLSVNTATGLISGTPTVTGAFGVILLATNSGGTGSATLILTIISGLPPFQLSITPASPVQVNANIPVVVAVSVVPSLQSFNLPVTVKVADGTQMQFDPICGNPPGFVSYTGGVLTFTIASPYSPATSFCMAAGQAVESIITPGADSVTITALTTGFLPLSVVHNFQIGVPELVVTPVTTFNISPGGTVLAQVALNAISGFNLPVKVFITGPGSSLGSTGPFLDNSISPAITSADCGPTTTGKTLNPGSSTTCQVTNGDSNVLPNTSSGYVASLEAFALFPTVNPGTAAFASFNVCVLVGATPSPGCGIGILRVETKLSRIGSSPQRLGKASASSDAPGSAVSAAGIRFSPLMPKEGDQVTIHFSVENHGESDVSGVPVALVINNQTVTTKTVDIAAGGAEAVEFVWEATYAPRLNAAISIGTDSSGDSSGAVLFSIPGLSVEPPSASSLLQGRSLLEVTNGGCAGFRFLTESQTSCGGSSDFELNPTITADGQLQVQVLSLTGGILDLGPQPISGVLSVPEGGYSVRGWLEGGHLYALESNGKYALVYVASIQSDIDPRLAQLVHGSNSLAQPNVEGLNDLLSDRLGELLDRARITVDLQWVYSDNGSHQFQYGFTGSRRAPSPSVLRQPRTSAPKQ